MDDEDRHRPLLAAQLPIHRLDDVVHGLEKTGPTTTSRRRVWRLTVGQASRHRAGRDEFGMSQHGRNGHSAARGEPSNVDAVRIHAIGALHLLDDLAQILDLGFR
jgi:hypothetical protein